MSVATRKAGMSLFSRGSARSKGADNRLARRDVLAWAVWFGLSAGLLEVGTRVLCRAIDSTGRLYLMSKHFVWLTPLANMLLFFGLGLLLAGMTRAWPRLGGSAQPQAAVCLGDSADAHGGRAGDFSGGLVHGRIGNRVAIGSVARVATGQTEACCCWPGVFPFCWDWS